MRLVPLTVALLAACAPELTSLPLEDAPPSFGVLLRGSDGATTSTGTCDDAAVFLWLALSATGAPPVVLRLDAEMAASPPPGFVPVTRVWTPRGSGLQAEVVPGSGYVAVSCLDGPGSEYIGLKTARGWVGAELTLTNGGPACPAGGLALPPLPEVGGGVELGDPQALGVTDPDDDPLRAVAVELIDSSGVGLHRGPVTDGAFTVQARDRYGRAPATMRVLITDGWYEQVCAGPITWDLAPVCSPRTVEAERGAGEVLVTAADLCLDPEGLAVTVVDVLDASGASVPVTITDTFSLPAPAVGSSAFTVQVTDGRNLSSLPFTVQVANGGPVCAEGRLATQVLGQPDLSTSVQGLASDPDGDPLEAVAVALISPDGESMPVSQVGGVITAAVPDPALMDRRVVWSKLQVTIHDNFGGTQACEFDVTTHEHAVCADELRRTVDAGTAEVLVTAADLCVEQSGAPITTSMMVAATGDLPFVQDATGDLRISLPAGLSGALPVTAAVAGVPSPVGFTIVARDRFLHAGSTPMLPESGGAVDLHTILPATLAGASCVGAEVIGADGSSLQRGPVRGGMFTIQALPVEEQGDEVVEPILIGACLDGGAPVTLSWDIPVDRAPVCAKGAPISVSPGARLVSLDPALDCVDPEGSALRIASLTSPTGVALPYQSQPDGSALLFLPSAPFSELQVQAGVSDGGSVKHLWYTITVR